MANRGVSVTLTFYPGKPEKSGYYMTYNAVVYEEEVLKGWFQSMPYSVKWGKWNTTDDGNDKYAIDERRVLMWAEIERAEEKLHGYCEDEYLSKDTGDTE